MTEHRVEFYAEDGCLVARCSCGWLRKWTPDRYEVPEEEYGLLFAMGLRHTAKSTP